MSNVTSQPPKPAEPCHGCGCLKVRSMTRLQGQLEAAMVKASREAQAKNVGLPSKTMERVQKEVVLYSC